MTLSQQLLEEQEVAYEAEEDQYTGEIERLESLPSSFADGSWSMEDMEWIVRWKSSRSIGYFERDDPEEVKGLVNDADKAKMVGANLADAHGFDVADLEDRIGDDEYDGTLEEPYSTTPFEVAA